MINALSQYLDSVRDNLSPILTSENDIICELQTHIEDKVEEMKEAGLSEEDATNTCIKLLGSAKLVARKIYEAHSQGTWKQALLASMPNLLFALLFVLNWWQGISWVIITLCLIVCTAIYGWYRGKPIWLFSWLGYSLLPVLVSGLLLLYLPKGWVWIAILVYIPLALWLVIAISIQAIKRDWLYSALMLMPMPIIFGWFLSAGQDGKIAELSLEYIQDTAPWIGLSFLALALTAAAFIRLRQRWLRVVLLFLSGFATLIMVVCYTEGRLSLPVFSMLSLLMLILLISPAIVDRILRHFRQRPAA
jgi:hypothetical protein